MNRFHDGRLRTAGAFLCLLSALTLLAPSFTAPAEAQPERPRSVLILHSYNPGLSWTEGIQKGIEAALSKASFPVSLRVEYLDAKNYQSKEYFDLMAAVLASKYAASPPDAVIVSDNAAFEFILDRRATFLTDVPMIFCGVNDFEAQMLRGDRLATGVSEAPSFRDTIALIRKLRPNARRIFVTGDKTLTTQINHQAIRKAAAMFPDLEFVYSREEDARALCAQVAALGEDTAILMVSVVRDESGLSLGFGESAERISRAAKVAVFSCWDFMLGHGVMGGKVVCSEDQGQAAGDMALALLSGEPVERIAVRYDSPNRFMFDDAVLRRFGVDEDDLPRGSQIVGKKPQFIQAHPELFWGTLALFAAMLAALAAMAVNVTRRKRAERRAAAGEKRLRLIADSMPALISHIGADERYLFVNRFYETTFGLDQDSILGRTVREIIGEKAYALVEDKIRTVLAGEPVTFEFDMPMPDGRAMAFNAHYVPGRDDEGRVDSYFLMGEDIGSFKRMREELRRTRNFLENIINSMPSFLAGVDSLVRVTHFNAEAERVSGVPRELALGRELGEVFALPGDLRDIIRSCIREQKAYKREKIPLRLAGADRVADLSVYPLPGGDAVGAVVRLDDVTQRTIMEEVMVQSEKMISLGGLAAGMAHEINNPLSGILQAAQVILRRLDPALAGNVKASQVCGVDLGGLRVYLEQRGVLRNLAGIRELGERAGKIVAGMLAFSRKSESRRAPVLVKEIVDVVLELASHDYDLRKRYDFRQMDIATDFDPDLPPIPCVRTEIEQVLFNLLKNAAQALSGATGLSGGAPPRIVIRSRRESEMAVIEMHDNGPGMSEEVRKKIFDPFYTTKGPGSGTGLGLSVSYFIVVENHKGKLLVESEPGQGSKFIVKLPLRAAG
jgi:PAS domain S-box-containing protein